MTDPTHLFFKLEYGRFEFLLMWWIALCDLWDSCKFKCWFHWQCLKNPGFPVIWERFCRIEDAKNRRLCKALAEALGAKLYDVIDEYD